MRNEVPSIENIKSCFKYGGIWDKKDEICLEKKANVPHAYYGCTAPIKGIKFCWNATESFIYHNYFVDEILAETNDVVATISGEVKTGSRLETLNQAEFVGQNLASALLKAYKTNKSIVCCNRSGKIIECSNPTAILTHQGENVHNIAESYRKKHKTPKLKSFTKDWKETKPRVYKGIHFKKGVEQAEFDFDKILKSVWLQWNIPGFVMRKKIGGVS